MNEPRVILQSCIVTFLTFDEPLSKSGIPDHIICFGPARRLSDYNGQIPSHRHVYVSQPQGNCVQPKMFHCSCAEVNESCASCVAQLMLFAVVMTIG